MRGRGTRPLRQYASVVLSFEAETITNDKAIADHLFAFICSIENSDLCSSSNEIKSYGEANYGKMC